MQVERYVFPVRLVKSSLMLQFQPTHAFPGPEDIFANPHLRAAAMAGVHGANGGAHGGAQGINPSNVGVNGPAAGIIDILSNPIVRTFVFTALRGAIESLATPAHGFNVDSTGTPIGPAAGLGDAFNNPQVRAALFGGPNGAVGGAFVQPGHGFYPDQNGPAAGLGDIFNNPYVRAALGGYLDQVAASEAFGGGQATHGIHSAARDALIKGLASATAGGYFPGASGQGNGFGGSPPPPFGAHVGDQARALPAFA